MTSALIICLCYCFLSFGLYLIWFSKWNIPAHLNLAFSLIAYVIPLVFLGVHERFPSHVIDEFARIMLLGTIGYAAGLFLGFLIAGRKPTRILRIRVARFDAIRASKVADRLVVAVVIGVILTLIAGAVMGGLPLFTDDPLSAKYFKGEIKERYDQVSIIYRVGTGILTVLPPITVALAFEDRSRRRLWVILSVIGLFLMLATLQRGPMAEGLLLVICVLLIWKQRYILTTVLIAGSYVAGTLMYAILHALGLSAIDPGTTAGNFISQIASTAPDVTDTASFLTSWMAQGQPLTLGRTMWGGLVPGQFHWNPAVWSLETQNFGLDVNQIRSGGLRLPVPVWGIVNFGEIGLILVPLIAGLITGFFVRRLSTMIPTTSKVGTTVMITIMNTLFLTIGSYYMLGYLEVLKAFVLFWVLWPAIKISTPKQSSNYGERFFLSRYSSTPHVVGNGASSISHPDNAEKRR